MQFYAVSVLGILLVASRCPAQLTFFVPCQFGTVFTIEHSQGITEERVNFFEPSGEVGTSVVIPDIDMPVPGIVFSHSQIRGLNSSADLLRFARALARGERLRLS